jgi:DNA-binding phage protein
MSEPADTEKLHIVNIEEAIKRYKDDDIRVKEYFVERELHKLIRSELAECYRRNRITHLKKCTDIAREYLMRVLKMENVPRLTTKPGTIKESSKNSQS